MSSPYSYEGGDQGVQSPADNPYSVEQPNDTFHGAQQNAYGTEQPASTNAYGTEQPASNAYGTEQPASNAYAVAQSDDNGGGAPSATGSTAVDGAEQDGPWLRYVLFLNAEERSALRIGDEHLAHAFSMVGDDVTSKRETMRAAQRATVK